MAYLARKPLTIWLRVALIPLLLFMTLSSSSGAVNSAESEHRPHIERYEHKMSQPARMLPPLPKSIPFMRAVYHGNPLPSEPEQGLPVCFVLLYPAFYHRLKRLLLQPLKYMSNYVKLHAQFFSSEFPKSSLMSILLPPLRRN